MTLVAQIDKPLCVQDGRADEPFQITGWGCAGSHITRIDYKQGYVDLAAILKFLRIVLIKLLVGIFYSF